MNGYPELPTGFEWETDPTINPMGLDTEPMGSGYTEGLASTFGYNDPMDAGVGAWGDNTNDPNAYGVSLPRQTLVDYFGDEDEAHGALVEITNPATGRTTIAPIVDKGPADWVVNRQGPTIDVTEGVRRDLGNTGLDAAQWRIIGKLPEGYTFEAPGTGEAGGQQPPPTSTTGTPQLPEGYTWDVENRYGENLNPQLSNSLFNLEQATGGQLPKIISGYRDPEHNARVGGASGSQHLHGNAVDIDTSEMSHDERLALIQQASASGIQGIGVYDNNLHFDVGERRAWGPSHGSESVPDWAQDTVLQHLRGEFKQAPPAAPQQLPQLPEGFSWEGQQAQQQPAEAPVSTTPTTPAGLQPSGPVDTFYKWGQDFTAAREQYAQTQQAQGKTVDPQKAISHAFQQATTRLSDESAQSIGLKNAKELKNVFKMLPSNIMEVDPATANEWFTEALRNASPELAKTTPPAGFQPEVGLKEQMLTPPATDLPTMSALEADRLGLQRWRDAESGMEVRRAGQPEERPAIPVHGGTPSPTPLVAKKYEGLSQTELQAKLEAAKPDYRPEWAPPAPANAPEDYRPEWAPPPVKPGEGLAGADLVKLGLQGATDQSLLSVLEGGYAAVAGVLPEGKIRDNAIHNRDEISKMRTNIREKHLPVDPKAAQSFLGGLASTVGQMPVNLLSYAIPGLGPLTSVLTLYDEGRQDYRDTMKEQGKPVDEAKANEAGWKYAMAAGPIDIAMDKLQISKFFKASQAKGWDTGKIVKEGAQLFTGGAAGEGLQQLWLNTVAKLQGDTGTVGYDPNRPTLAGVPESAAVGGGASLLVGGAGAARKAPTVEAALNTAAEQAKAQLAAGPEAPPAAQTAPFAATAPSAKAAETSASLAAQKPQPQAAPQIMKDFSQLPEGMGTQPTPTAPTPVAATTPAGAAPTTPAGAATQPTYTPEQEAEVQELMAQYQARGGAFGRGAPVTEPTTPAGTAPKPQGIIGQFLGGVRRAVFGKSQFEVSQEAAKRHYKERQILSDQRHRDPALWEAEIEAPMREQAMQSPVVKALGADIEFNPGMDAPMAAAYSPSGKFTLIINPVEMQALENTSGNTGQAFSFYLGEELDHFGEFGWVKDTIYDPAIKAYKEAHAQWVAGGQQGPAPQPKYAELHDAVVENRARLFVDMRHTLEAAPPSEQQALYQAVVDSYNVYFSQSATQPSPGSKGLKATASKADQIFKEIAYDPNKNFSSFVAEFTRQARQQRNQGNITESVWRKVLELVKGWFRQSIDRLQQSLPGVQEGKFGADIQRHVQNIEDFLSGKGVEIAPPGAPTTWQKGGAKGLPAPIKNIVNVHNSKGGSTVNAVHGDITYSNAYSVSIFPDLGVTSPGKRVTEKQIADFDAKLRAAGVDTSSPNFSIGTWYDAKSDTTYIDAAITTHERDKAIALGKQFNQKAIYSLGDMAEIPTGGTGLDPGNLPSIQERLASFTSTGYTIPYARTTTQETTGAGEQLRAPQEGVPRGGEGRPEALGGIQSQAARGLPKEPQEAGVAKPKKLDPPDFPAYMAKQEAAYTEGRAAQIAALKRGDNAEAARLYAELDPLQKLANKAADLVLTEEQVDAMAREGEAYKQWYKDFSDFLDEFLGPYKEYAPLIKEFLAATSPQEGIEGNVQKTVLNFIHYVETGEIISPWKTHADNLKRVVLGEKISGPKVGEYSPALHGDPLTTTMDRHMFKIFFGNQNPTDKKRAIGTDQIFRAAARLGWDPTQVQAAMWGAHLARQGKDVSGAKTYGAFLEKHRDRLEEVFRREAIHGGRGREAARAAARGISERAGPERAARQAAFERSREGRGLEKVKKPKPESAEAEARRYEAGPAGIPAAATAPAGRTVAPDARIKRGFYRLMSGARDVFNATPGIEFLGSAITKHVDTNAALKGELGSGLVARGMLGKAGRATKEFRQYVDTWLDPKKGKVAADALPLGPEAQRLVAEANESIRKMKDHATRLKIEGPAGDFPEMLLTQTMQAIENPAENKPHWDRLKDEMVRDKIIPNGTPDEIELAARLHVQKVKEDYLDHKSIAGKLPPSAFDRSLQGLTKYVNEFADRGSLREAFGSKTFTPAGAPTGANAFDIARKRTTDPKTLNYINAVENLAYGRSSGDVWNMIINAGSQLATTTQLGNWRTTAKNLTSGVANNLSAFGLFHGINPVNLAKIFHAIKDGKEKGILLNDLTNQMNDANKQGWLSKAVGTTLKYAAFNASESLVRGQAIVGAKALYRWGLKAYKKNPSSRASLQFLGQVKRLGFGKPEDLIKADGKGPLFDTYLRRMVNRVQAGYSYADVPLYLSSDAGKFIQQYGKYGTEHLNRVIRDIVNPFIRNVGLGKRETVEVTDPKTGKTETMSVPGEIAPIFRYFFILAAAGAGWEWIAENVFGTKSQFASWEEIGTKLERGDRQAIGDALAKFSSYLFNMGTLGIIGDKIRAGLDVAKGKQSLKEAILDIPGLSAASEGADILQDFFDKQDWRTVDGWKTLGDNLGKQMSYYRVGKEVLGQVGRAAGLEPGDDAIGWLARESEKTARIQDRAWVRATGRRFDSELGIIKPRTGEGSGPTAATAIKERLWDHIMLGEVDKAQALIDEQSERFDNPDDRKKFMKGLEASIRNKQPINAAGGGEAGRVLFNRWAEENLPTEERARLERIDQEYRETATQLGLMKGNKHVPESEVRELQESLLRARERNEAESPWGWTRPVTNPAGEVTMEAMRAIMEGKRSLGELTGAF